ncbi:signal recognition particle-docking protein FtsY [Limosilactobacillus caccae]|uniref:signal recognition particle-docking protein FtsY n=1 Tax=Limosilactobacillus caccae TaxID=1926284 RepID=UPI000970CA35|nr:signal recognition particle-docking protein FtsY [Limosilactobacillus caccae]
MGLFDIFRRHKKKEEKHENEVSSASSAVEEQAVASDSAQSATPLDSAGHKKPVKIPPAIAEVDEISPDGQRKTIQHEGELPPAVDDEPASSQEEAEAPVDRQAEETSAASASPAPAVSAEPASSEPTSTAVTPEKPAEASIETPAPSEASASASVEEDTTVEDLAETTSEEVPASSEEATAPTISATDTPASSAEEEPAAAEETEDSSATVDEAVAEVKESATAVTTSEEVAEDVEEKPAEAPADAAAEKEKKYDHGLEKSRTGFGARLNKFLANFRHVDEDFFDDLEDMLIESDVGYDMAMKLSDELREEVKLQNAKSKQDVSNVIIEKMVDLYDEAGKDENPNLTMAKEGPTVIMFVGVNGAGKTTTIGKMAALFKKQGKKVLLAAADTFRAGATEQLDVWAKRDGVDIVTGPENGDPAAVVFDAVKKAKSEDYDILFVDTAGRLQNKVNLMNELAKMKRILTREIPAAPHEVLLVLDATTGQNALNQAKLFKQSTDVSGIVLTKLDGTARGGIVLAIRNELHLPVKYVGLGEKVDDLQKFDAGDFVYGLFKGLVEVD